MRVNKRKLIPALVFGALVAVASAAPSRTAAAEQGLLEFDNFECPGDCPIGADPCCAILPPICVPGPCET